MSYFFPGVNHQRKWERKHGMHSRDLYGIFLCLIPRPSSKPQLAAVDRTLLLSLYGSILHVLLVVPCMLYILAILLLSSLALLLCHHPQRKGGRALTALRALLSLSVYLSLSPSLSSLGHATCNARCVSCPSSVGQHSNSNQQLTARCKWRVRQRCIRSTSPLIIESDSLGVALFWRKLQEELQAV